MVFLSSYRHRLITVYIFVILFYQTFLLLAYHYVYRYVLLCRCVTFPLSGAFDILENMKL